MGQEGEDLSRHDKWLCMMYPRLKLLHKLLSDRGAIFISIDDNEQANLKLICDEVFGSRNYISSNTFICNSPQSETVCFVMLIIWGTSVPRKTAEEINEFLKKCGYTKVELIQAGYEELLARHNTAFAKLKDGYDDFFESELTQFAEERNKT